MTKSQLQSEVERLQRALRLVIAAGRDERNSHPYRVGVMETVARIALDGSEVTVDLPVEGHRETPL